jgi:NitT/TauT family transport system ATP-binding protein
MQLCALLDSSNWHICTVNQRWSAERGEEDRMNVVQTDEVAAVPQVMLRAVGLSKVFATPDGQKRGIERLDFELLRGQVLTVFGPNGSGKSTLLNLVAGLAQPDSGELSSDFGPLWQIKKCYVWQNYRDALLPWKNVMENIAFPLKLAGVPRHERHERVRELLKRFDVRIDPSARVYNLSGGEQQTVSILRGLIIEPQIMLMDEPFSALDYQMNLAMQAKLQEIWQATHLTTIFVSHDLDQAILLADKLILLSAGPCVILKEFDRSAIGRPRSVESLGDADHIAVKQEILRLFRRTRS